ncbi:MAG TPA: c-type cytochrome, partial [Polyangia bacterium]
VVLAGCAPAPHDNGGPRGAGGAIPRATGGSGGFEVPAGTGGGAGAGGSSVSVGTGGVRAAPPSSGFLTVAPVESKAFTPAISGGTLLVLKDGNTAFAADPDRDALYFADLTTEKLLSTLKLDAGDEPGRAVEDATGGVHVVLRRAGAVLSLKPDRTVRDKRAVCPAPRGMALDAAGDLHVACAGGELVTLAAAGGEAKRTVRFERDLRDVVVGRDRLYVSTFRSAELLVVSASDGQLLNRFQAPGSQASQGLTMSSMGALRAALPGVAWRLRARPDGTVAMIHQEGTNGELSTLPGGYAGGPCKSAFGAAVTTFPETGTPTTSAHMMMATLPVDFAYSRDGKRVATVLAGSAYSFDQKPQIVYSPADPGTQTQGCMFPNPTPIMPPEEVVEYRQPTGAATAVEFDGKGRVIVQTREPAGIEIVSHRGGTIKLSDESRYDSGHALFHVSTFASLACASCHPEGGDDGRVWHFQKIGPRRTQTLRGGIADSAPFHWDGDMKDLTHLMAEVFSGRMGGPMVSGEHVGVMGRWMARLPGVPSSPGLDSAAIARGKALFNDTKVACATCHSGALYSNNTTVDVGTGKAFQVPTLKGISGRAPFMHNGCAPTLTARFDPTCGGGDKHGVTSHLGEAQISDLVKYLETL